MKTYRVFPHLTNAADDEPGGVLYALAQGAGRFDNAGQYRIRYASTTPEGAIAETFGRLSEWRPAMLIGPPSLPSSTYAIVELTLSDDLRLCDLDDPRRLMMLNLRPSDVVARNYETTTAAALRIYESGKYDGLGWWSYYEPKWTSLGFWNDALIIGINVTKLAIDSRALVSAADAIRRPLRSK